MGIDRINMKMTAISMTICRLRGAGVIRIGGMPRLWTGSPHMHNGPGSDWSSIARHGRWVANFSINYHTICHPLSPSHSAHHPVYSSPPFSHFFFTYWRFQIFKIDTATPWINEWPHWKKFSSSSTILILVFITFMTIPVTIYLNNVGWFSLQMKVITVIGYIL